jgi:hypothetical protein
VPMNPWFESMERPWIEIAAPEDGR